MPDEIAPKIERAKIIAKNEAVSLATIYGTNANGDRAAFILPDTTPNSAFVPDPDGVNINGAKVAKLIFQARLNSDPTAFGNSKVGTWNSTIWEPLTGTPGAKASHYANYDMTTGDVGDPDFPQEIGVRVLKGVMPAAQQHGKLETLIVVGDIEDGANAKLVLIQAVGRFAGTDVGWNYNTDDDGEDDSSAGDLDDDGTAAVTRSAYPGWGVKVNSSGPTPMFAYFGASSRTGSYAHHCVYAKKNSLTSFFLRHKNSFGVQVIGFDPGDGGGAHVMPYMGLGTDLPEAPVHIKGPMALEAVLESTQTVTAATPYLLGRLTFKGRNDLGTSTYVMAGLRVNVIDPSHGHEDATTTVEAIVDGTVADSMVFGAGAYTPGATGGDKGADTLNLKGLYVDGVIAVGDDPTAAAAVTAISVAQSAKGMVCKATGPVDKRLRSVNVYRHTANVPASATLVDNYPARSGQKIKWVDTDALTSGTTYYYFFATITKEDVESTTRTLIGSATYKGVQAADLEVGAVDMASNKVTGKTGANITYTSGGGTLDSLKPGEAGANVTETRFAKGGKVDTSATGTDSAPSVYRALGAIRVEEQKTRSALGVSGSATDGVLSTKVTSTTTGANTIHQVFVSSDGEFKRRNSSESAWTAWKQAFTQEQPPSTTDLPDAGALSRKSAVDLATGDVTNKLAANISYTGGATVDSLKPAAVGADVTGSNYAKGTAVNTAAPTTDQVPSYYTGLGTNTLHELKSVATLGLTSADTYCTIAVKYPGSGAKVIQTADLSDGRWRRSSNGASAWNAWKKVFDPDNPPSTTDLPDAGGLSRLDPSDLVDYPGRNISGSAGQSITLTYGTDKPNLSVKNTSAGAYTVTLAGGAAGDAFTIGNSTASTQNVSVVGDATYTLPPGTEGVFLYQTSPGGFNLRLQRVLSDLTTNLIPPSLIPVGTSAGTVAAGNDTRIANALQTSVVGVTVQGYSANLAAVSGLTFAADKFMYSTGAGALSLANVTSQGRSILAQSGAIGVQTVLGLVPGTDVQPYDADLAAVAALTSPATTITGAMQKSSNGGDIANTTTFKANLGLATVASSGSASDLSTGVLGSSRGGAGAISGLLKANGAGVVSAASFASDYAASNSTMSWTATHTFTNAPRGATDNAVQLGTAALRWSQLYAGTTTINTSDAREKCEVGDIPQAVIDVICALPIQAFKWIDAVAEKGDAARWHYGWIAQSVAAAVTAAGYDPHAYGFYCVDGLTDLVEDIDVPRIDPETGEQAVRYGLRLDYLFAIRLEGDARRLAALEARVSALEAA